MHCECGQPVGTCWNQNLLEPVRTCWNLLALVRTQQELQKCFTCGLLLLFVSSCHLQRLAAVMLKTGGTREPGEMQIDASIIRIPPHHYIHVLDQNTNIARVEIGPLTYIRQDNERCASPTFVHPEVLPHFGSGVTSGPLVSPQGSVRAGPNDHGATSTLLRGVQPRRPGR